ncbi:hypothetical protein [Bdellovibrio sp. HCB-162]|uniref:hypothetical protein n=1 Tax=Bdellovibrio sp. HCB-162 TaxID=3394234 RepID=UPI0039BD2297
METHKFTTKLFALFVATQILGCAPEDAAEKAPPEEPDLQEQELEDSSLAVMNSSEEEDDSTETAEAPSDFSLADEVKKYQDRFKVADTHTKLVDNRGHGMETLYGTRNFRVVLHGVMYRGGANNKYFYKRRANINPLPTTGLKNLCKNDFSTAVYLYSENYWKAPKVVSCRDTVKATDNSLRYKQYAAAGENKKILRLVYERIKGRLNGPIYTHCWNGWHSSGLISAMALKQFCGWSSSHAEAYWRLNTDGNSHGYSRLRQKLRNFKPYPEFRITEEEKALICPEN